MISYLLMAQVQFGSIASVQGHFRSYTVTWVFTRNFLQKKNRVMWMLFLASQDASIDMHMTDMLVEDSDTSQILTNHKSGSKYNCCITKIIKEIFKMFFVCKSCPIFDIMVMYIKNKCRLSFILTVFRIICLNLNSNFKFLRYAFTCSIDLLFSEF